MRAKDNAFQENERHVAMGKGRRKGKIEDSMKSPLAKRKNVLTASLHWTTSLMR